MRPTDYVTVTLKGLAKKPLTFAMPLAVGRRIGDLISASAKRESGKAVPARKVLPELGDDRLRPAMLLRGARHRAALTQKKLADKAAIRQHHLSEMETGKRPIGKAMAKRLANILKCDYRLLM